MLFLVRVNMTDGNLPTGLYREVLSQTLRDIEFCVTNLRSLPEALDLTWPHTATIYLEAGNLTEIPPSLVRLTTFDLSLALNPISTLPAEIIEGNEWLHVGGTHISELPEVIENVSPLFKIRVDNTNISFFWNWTDPMVASANGGEGDGIPTILASNTPYCADLERIYTREQASFSAPQQEGQSLLLSDASVDNWPTWRGPCRASSGQRRTTRSRRKTSTAGSLILDNHFTLKPQHFTSLPPSKQPQQARCSQRPVVTTTTIARAYHFNLPIYATCEN